MRQPKVTAAREPIITVQHSSSLPAVEEEIVSKIVYEDDDLDAIADEFK